MFYFPSSRSQKGRERGLRFLGSTFDMNHGIGFLQQYTRRKYYLHFTKEEKVQRSYITEVTQPGSNAV